MYLWAYESNATVKEFLSLLPGMGVAIMVWTAGAGDEGVWGDWNKR